MKTQSSIGTRVVSNFDVLARSADPDYIGNEVGCSHSFPRPTIVEKFIGTLADMLVSIESDDRDLGGNTLPNAIDDQDII